MECLPGEPSTSDPDVPAAPPKCVELSRILRIERAKICQRSFLKRANGWHWRRTPAEEIGRHRCLLRSYGNMADVLEQSAPWFDALRELLRLQSVVCAAVLGLLAGGALRLLLLLGLDAQQSRPHAALRLLVALGYVGLLLGYLSLVGPMLQWDLRSLAIAGGAVLVMVAGLLFWKVLRGTVPRPSLVSFLLRTVLVLLVLLLALVSVMRAGFLHLTTDRPVLLLELSGETRKQTVRWAAPDQPMQEVEMTAHHIRFRTPEGALFSEEWLYGDQVAVKGRSLRFHPFLNAAGVTNLFDLQFVHNGYFTAERHNTNPHQARPLMPIGSLSAPPKLLPLRDGLLHFLAQRPDNSRWTVRAVTSESTYFPLVDSQGQPVKRTFELVLTPFGLTAR